MLIVGLSNNNKGSLPLGNVEPQGKRTVLFNRVGLYDKDSTRPHIASRGNERKTLWSDHDELLSSNILVIEIQSPTVI
ncbi:hypothetical protein BHYA_0018g00260 [Botrytis hyacinthi]|uniref:Uncharacterized protein n=1 Tax=Botrytis hyacinthi TaxID=278943 RepID=A0A4Z1GYL9_9HELO|nr:hypothetical protein BHYA_0018g00260 [Botrytis hyacinthi]